MSCVSSDLDNLYKAVTTGCLCSYENNDCAYSLLRSRLSATSDFQNELVRMSILRLLFDLLNYSGGSVCCSVDSLICLLKEELVTQVICFKTNNLYVSYLNRKVLSSFVSNVADDAQASGLVESICWKIVKEDNLTLSFSFAVLTDVVDNALNGNDLIHRINAENCKKVIIHKNNAKVACKALVEVLGNGMWTDIVAKVVHLEENHTKCFMTFLYKLVQFIKRHHSVEFLDSFFSQSVMMAFFKISNTTPILLRTQADIVAEVLCEDENDRFRKNWKEKFAEMWLLQARNLTFEMYDQVLQRKIILSVLHAYLILQSVGNVDPNAIYRLEALSRINLVDLFLDQDDQLIQVMLAVLNLHRLNSANVTPSPHEVFLQFLTAIACDHDVILDFLISCETSFLLFFTKYLKLVGCEWEEFVRHASSSHQEAMNLDVAMTTLIRTRMSIERLHSKEIFPYNAEPLLKLLEKCEQLYESVEND